jgi:hypothetical protein
MTETMWLDGAGSVCQPGMGEPFEMHRLDEARRYEAINDFVWHRLGLECSDEDFDQFAVGCTVLYRDHYDTGCSEYQVVDAFGHGDGTGEWHPVE